MNSTTFDLKNLRFKQQALALLIFSFVTVLIWIVVGIATSQREERISPELQALAKPLNPNINEKVLSAIEQKRRYSAAELARFPIYRIVSDDDIRQAASSQSTSATTSIVGPNLSNELQLPVDASPSTSLVATQSANPSGTTSPSTTIP